MIRTYCAKELLVTLGSRPSGMLFRTKVSSWAASPVDSEEAVVEVASLLAAEETSEMFWGSLEAPQALSKETASVPARAALMTFFFMCIPLEKK